MSWSSLCHIQMSFSSHSPDVVGDEPVQQIMENTRGLSLLVNLNWDRLLYLATICVALGFGAFVGSL